MKTKKTGKSAFFEVSAPLTATKIQLYGTSMDSFVGKVVVLDLTRSLKGKSLELRLRVKKEGTELVGEPESLILIGSYIRKMIRKGTDYIEDSFIIPCKDGRVIVKPFLITRNKVSRAIRNELRVMTRSIIETYMKTRTLEELFSDISTNKVQKELAVRLKKIYPLALCEIRWFEIFKEKGVVKSEAKA